MPVQSSREQSRASGWATPDLGLWHHVFLYCPLPTSAARGQSEWGFWTEFPPPAKDTVTPPCNLGLMSPQSLPFAAGGFRALGS